MDNKTDDLYIPSNIKTRLEFFKGFGIKELVITAIVMAISLPFILLINNLSNTITALIILFIIIAGTIVSVIKDDNSLCVAKQIGFMVKYNDMQKKFKYEFYDKWRDK